MLVIDALNDAGCRLHVEGTARPGQGIGYFISTISKLEAVYSRECSSQPK